MSKDRQQRANVKARKAKAKAREAEHYRSWIDRPRHCAPRRQVHAMDGLAMMLGASSLFRAPTAEEMAAKERFLCRVFGEDPTTNAQATGGEDRG